MRLCVYTDSSTLGGAELVLGHLVAELSDSIAITVMGVDRAVVDAVAAGRPAASTVVLEAVRGKFDILGLWDHRRAIARARPDVFQANLTWLWSCRYALATALTVPGVTVIAVEHSLFEPHYRRAKVLKRWMSRRLGAHVTVGRALRRPLETVAGLPPGSVRAIPNGVPPVSVAPRRFPTDGLVVGTAARLEPAKGIDLLLDATAGFDDVTVVVIGDGPGRAGLERLAIVHGMTHRVHITGWSDDARAWLAGLDVFVLPSYREALPLSLIEAMLAGVPVVATRVGSVSDAVIDGETGLLVDPGDVDGLRAALGRVVGGPAHRRRRGQAGRAHALSNFTAEVMARSYEDLYRDLIERRSSMASR